jgi:Protein of unknown function (DUF2934)
MPLSTSNEHHNSCSKKTDLNGRRSTERQSDCAYRQQWISEAAYYKAKNRNFEPGFEEYDWQLSEQEFMKTMVTHFLNICSEDGGITLIGLQRLAKLLGIENSETFSHKDELIHVIQLLTHNDACFDNYLYKDCKRSDPCLWRAECKKLTAQYIY